MNDPIPTAPALSDVAAGLSGMPNLAFGFRLTLPGAGAADVLTQCRPDFVILDQEHGAAGPESLVVQMLACEARGVPALVRPPSADPAHVARLLDLGAAGLLAPATPDAAAAAALVAAMRFPPEGRRGVTGGTARAAGYGADDAYEATWNSRAMLWAQIESPSALDHAAAMAAVDGVDALFFGPADFAAAAGYPGAATVLSALRTMIAAAKAAGKRAGATPFADLDAAALVAEGVDVVLIGSDAGLLRTGAIGALALARAAP